MTNIFIRSSINDFEMKSVYDEMENSTSLYDEIGQNDIPLRRNRKFDIPL